MNSDIRLEEERHFTGCGSMCIAGPPRQRWTSRQAIDDDSVRGSHGRGTRWWLGGGTRGVTCWVVAPEVDHVGWWHQRLDTLGCGTELLSPLMVVAHYLLLGWVENILVARPCWVGGHPVFGCLTREEAWC